jgi:hypothetical protein
VLLLFRAKITSYMQKTEKQMLDRASAYRVIRSMCSPQLNAITIVDPTFIAVEKTDPLALLAAIKPVVTSRYTATSNSKGPRPYETDTR